MRTHTVAMGLIWLSSALAGCGDGTLRLGTAVQQADPDSPVLTSFAATATKASSTGSTRITWTWSFANTPASKSECSVDHGIGRVTNGSETVVTLTEDTVFTLTCTNGAGSDTAVKAIKAAPKDTPAPTPRCGPDNCSGCCDVDAVCRDGTGDNTLCGSLGTACVDCTPSSGSCESNRCTNCTPDCSDKTCGESDGCGDTCKAGAGCCEPNCSGQICGASDRCGGTCEKGSGCCEPKCSDKTCGEPDGCDGTCKAGSGCCKPNCEGKTCGASDGCGGTCKSGSGCCEPKCLGEICGASNGCGATCKSGSGCCEPKCSGKICSASDGCGGTCKSGSGCCEPECSGKTCGAPDGCDGTCRSGSGCCTPRCSGKICGASDDCGGTCNGSGCCEPECAGKNCGASDGCGGTCKSGSGCCAPKCMGKNCGAADGCGGTCTSGSGCCTPSCSGRTCGTSDGCGGTCTSGSGCCTPSCSGKSCGAADGCGGTCQSSSGCTVCPTSPCDLMQQCGCAAGQACHTTYQPDGATKCRAIEGNGMELTPCTKSEQCAKGFLCQGDKEHKWTRCRRFCRTDADCPHNFDICRPLNSGTVANTKYCTSPCDPMNLSTPDCPAGWQCHALTDSASGRHFPECSKIGSVQILDPCTTAADCSLGLSCVFSASGGKCKQECQMAPTTSYCTPWTKCYSYKQKLIIGPIEYGYCDF